MKKITILLAVFSLSIGVCYADDCTGRLNGYIAGKEAGLKSVAMDSAEATNVREQLQGINLLRNEKTDCEIASLVPELKMTDEATQKALEMTRKKMNQ